VRVDGVVGPHTRSAIRRTADAVSRGASHTRHTGTRGTIPAAGDAGARGPATRPAASPSHARPATQPAPLDLGSGPTWWHQPFLLGLVAAFAVAFAGVMWPRLRRRTSAYKYARAHAAPRQPVSEPSTVAVAEWAPLIAAAPTFPPESSP
jgi:peptidoglycan hydrolase-like protein with peptidoglycan-binding domain